MLGRQARRPCSEAAARQSQVGCEHMNRRWVRKGVFLLQDYVNINTDRRLCGKTEGCESKPLLSVKIIAQFWKHCTHCSIMFWLHSQEASFFFFFPLRTSHLNSSNRFSSLIISLYFRQIILRAWWECYITWLWLPSDCVTSCTELGRACASCSRGPSQPLPEPDHNSKEAGSLSTAESYTQPQPGCSCALKLGIQLCLHSYLITVKWWSTVFLKCFPSPSKHHVTYNFYSVL